MAITSITIIQDNKIGDSDLLAVHSPLSFIVEVKYTTTTPEELGCDVLISGILQDSYRMIPLRDLSPTTRQFIFMADQILRSKMQGFDDFTQLNETLLPVSDITQEFELLFYDIDVPATNETLTFTACHAARQFDDVNGANMLDIYNNESDTYVGYEGQPVYVYFYNDNPSANLSIGIDVSLVQENAVDFDDQEFTDFNDEVFTISVIA